MQHPIYLIRKIFGEHNRKPYLMEMRSRLTNHDFSLFSPACMGGVICSDLGVRFNSPTVNLLIRFDDFLRLMENLSYYLSLTPVPTKREGKHFPVLLLGDIKIYCVHYHSNKKAIQKWVERAKRVNYDDIRVIMSGLPWQNEDIVRRFEALPYKKMVVTDYPDAPQKDYVKKIVTNRGKTATLFNYKNFKGQRYYDQVDFVEFFNK
ncbi:MAG: DUF1919 domain-containing protein [Clostridia bacterium]|nr:DUF1919 domain-containing protein [Clostridia bacterium]